MTPQIASETAPKTGAQAIPISAPPQAAYGDALRPAIALARNRIVPSPDVPSIAERPVERPRLCRMSDLLGDWADDAQEAHRARTTGAPRGPLTGLRALDRELGGCWAPGLHIAHGQPGAGKTAFALQVAANCACPCLYLTCEMAPLELLRRLTARATNTFLGRLKSGELKPSDSLELARQGAAAAPQLAMVDGTRAYASPSYLRECAQIARGEHRHLLIVVDSLHSWAESAAATAAGATEYDALNVALLALKRLASDLNCPVLAIAERNRGAMQGGGLSAGAGSRKIEYGAETVLDLERGEAPREDLAGEVQVKAKLCKNRHGAAGKSVQLKFHGALQRFEEATQQ